MAAAKAGWVESPAAAPNAMDFSTVRLLERGPFSSISVTFSDLYLEQKDCLQAGSLRDYTGVSRA